MPPPSTSGAPLVAPRRKKNKESWTTRAMDAMNPTKLFSRSKKPRPPRSIYINQPLPAESYDKKGRIQKALFYPTNQNVTSKYSVITFLPRNLLEQFRRVANVFFLSIAILQFFPKFSTISAGLVILPLLFVLAITAAKDGYEDVKRHQADHKVNHSIVHVLEGGDEYTNVNPMGTKTKTFIPAIPLPRLRSKKAKLAEKQAKLDNENTTVTEPQGAVPTGNTEPHTISRVRSQADNVSTWEEDPEAGDGKKELGWQRTIWEDVRVGDIVKIYDGEQFPADLVILSTSEEEDVAYIETKNLDGETNLKSRHGVTGMSHMRTVEDCIHTSFRVDLDAPEVNMFRLNGAIVRDGEHEVHPINLETTLLRGCVLKNTAWVVAIVIFTGADTKIVQNSGGTPSKRSKVERQMNPQVLSNLVLLGIVAMVCAIVDHFNEVKWYNMGAYWELYADTTGDNPSINGLVTFANAFITFQNIVPISLYISIEFVRTAQAAFIYWDHSIKYVKNGVTTRTTARSWNLSDDLGQIEYVFSDKTGTLTQNAMIFRQCSVGGKIYTGDGTSPDGTLAGGKPAKASSSDSDSSEGSPKVALAKEVLLPFHDAQLDKDLEDSDSEQSRVLHGFFAVLGLCHTVLAAEPEPGVIEYKAQSPDEAALVQSAADVGFVFRGRDHSVVRLSTPFSEEPDEYELLHVLEFNSSRKRMSVILRKLDEDGRLFLLVKGADNVIFERLTDDASQKELREKTDQDLQHFASEGLRTLCLAYKVLDPNTYAQWAREYHEASVSLEFREKKMEDVSAKIETGLTLLGATAIEDKLQDGVPEAISDLKRAGIKVWVATGDKLETAVAIGYTTNLLTKDTNLIIVREGRTSIYDQLRDALETFFGEDPALTRTMSRMSHRAPGIERDGPSQPRLDRVNTGIRSLVGNDNGTRPGGFSLVIDGHALTDAFDDEDTEELLLALSTRCTTVVCCRVSPLQKAQIVHLIKDNLGVMCLAIGDGANDVSMIQAADVGVGISGEEGLQAVNSSDYAIAQFKYLKRLLLVHGHWSYYRNSNMILNFFYKNVIGTGVLFWFMIYCGWSTTYVFAYVYLLFWNIFWTLLPVIAQGLFDRDIDATTLMALPELYRYGREGRYFGLKQFFYYMFEGAYQSAVIFFFLVYTYLTTTTRGDGYDVYIYEMSTTMAIAAALVANFFIGLNIDNWNGWVIFAILFGPVLIWLFTAIYSIITPASFYTGVYGNDVFLFRSAAFWFGWPFAVIIALLPRLLYRAIRQNYLPNDIDLMRLVRTFHPEVDVETHPLLGGKLGDDVDENRPRTDFGPNAEAHEPGHEGEVEMNDLYSHTTSPRKHSAFGTGDKDKHSNLTPGYGAAGAGNRPIYQPRTSMNSIRNVVSNSSARGSQLDMSTGLSREASRGFDFNMEEGGVAIARMQSRLSETSRNSRPRRFTIRRGNNASSGEKDKTLLAVPGSPFGKMKTRAGSILSRKRGGSESGPTSAPPTPVLGSLLRNRQDSGPFADPSGSPPLVQKTRGSLV
ncbi:phospholipid-translocating ATPase, partial [Tremellales sp. Uapishka_1]